MPGVLFRISYRNAIYAVPFRFKDTGEEIFFGVLAAIFIHTSLILMLFWAPESIAKAIWIKNSTIPKIEVRRSHGELPITNSWELSQTKKEVLLFLAGPAAAPTEKSEQAIDHLASNAGSVLLYIALSCLIGAVLGGVYCRFIEKYHLDIKHPLLIDPNPWKRTLSGRDFVLKYLREEEKIRRPTNSDIANALETVKLRLISAIVEVGKECYIYNGFLEGFELSEQGELDRLIITYAFRFKFPTNWDESIERALLNPNGLEKKDAVFYRIAGHKFILQSKDIKTLNIWFFNVRLPSAPRSSSGASS